MSETGIKSIASTILIVVVLSAIACYLSACSSFNAEVSFNAITGSGRATLQSTK